MVTTRTQELKKRSSAHVFHTFGVPGSEPKLIFEKGKGAYLWDTDGNQYLDMMSYAFCGYGRKELLDAAYEQTKKLSYSPMSRDSNIPVIEYAEELTKFAPKNINHFQFHNGGSEAVESALRFAKAYWYFQGKATKFKIIYLMEGYHGATYLTGSLIGDYGSRAPFGPDAPGMIRIPNFNCYRCPLDLKYPDCGIGCAKFLERVIEEEGEDSIAAFISETIQGAGGIITPPPEYWPMVREICTKHHVLMIADEVMAGFCRTGKNFGIDNWNVEPDLMTMAKGIASVHWPLSAVGIGDKVNNVSGNHSMMQGFTTSGHPVGCAVGKACLDIYVKENICEHVTKVGNHIRERLEKEFLPLPNIGNVGGLGLFQALEIVADKETKRRFPPEIGVMRNVIARQCLERKGVLPRFFSLRKHDRLSIAPALIVTEEEIDKALDILYPILAGLKDLKVK